MKRRILFIIKHIIKAIIYFILLCVLGVSYAIVIGVEPILQYIYGAVVFICLAAFGLTYFARFRKVSYILFGCSLLGFILMSKYVPEIKEKHDIDACLDAGHGVWDYNEHRCRTDCWHWSKETGCEKIEPEVE